MEAVQVGCIRWVAEEPCGRTSGERRYTEKQKPKMVDGRGGEGRGGKRGAWKMIEGYRDRWEQPPTDLRHLCDQKTARRAVDRARRSMGEEIYRKLGVGGVKKMIFKMARDRTKDGRNVTRDAVITNHYGRLITESKEVLRIRAAYYMELLNGKRAVGSSFRAWLGEMWKWRR